MDKSIEEFEQWFKSDYHPDKAGPYIKDSMRFAWQASRKALVVELPNLLQPGADGPDDWYLHSDPEGEYMKADGVIDALRAAGITVRGEGDDTQSQNSA